MISPEWRQRCPLWHPLRFFHLLAASTAGVLTSLAGARALLLQLPRPTPETGSRLLVLEQRLALNPERRRQAALLRASHNSATPARVQRVLAAQGWGQGPLAAVITKQQALTATRLGQTERARQLWQRLLQRHGDAPASADGLYALGRQQPRLHRTLLQRWPAHPAALAAASENPGLSGALHLARWGARWPGAAARLISACRGSGLSGPQRQQLAQGLATVGATGEATQCLAGAAALPATTVLLAQAELHGSAEEQQRAITRLAALARQPLRRPEADTAVRLLAAEDSPTAREAVDRLPAPWQSTAAVQASRARRSPDPQATLAVLRRWPDDAASWELQWQQGRRSALEGRWRDALLLFEAGGPRLEATLPAALQARRRFWLGLSQAQLGNTVAARATWQRLLQERPGGYYGWRAAARLGTVTDRQVPAATGAAPVLQERWQPLESGVAAVDRLWQLNQPLEAWEHWRTTRGGSPPSGSQALQAEGRLREAIGDGWAGLGQQELAALRLPPRRCALENRIEQSRFRPRQLQPLETAAQAEGVPIQLLLGVAKQESRFQSDVRSVVGAVGLLQLMPETAAELNGTPLSGAQLVDPARNARLGARYLRMLLQRWSGNAVLAAASYNAGPNAVARWLNPTLQTLPELWIEAIPYPETRHYVKTVLGNSWSFAAPRLSRCS